MNNVTYTTTEFAVGEAAVGQLAFSTDPTSGQNCATVPVTKANINGHTVLGSAQ